MINITMSRFSRNRRRTAHLTGAILMAISQMLPQSALAQNALATPAQIKSEQKLLAFERSAPIQKVRSELRDALLSDPAAATPDGRASLDRALDQWIRFYITMQLTNKPTPEFLWIADNTPRTWYGHTFPGDFIAGDNPDNTNRGVFLDGDSAYVLRGRYATPKSAQFSLNIEISTPTGIALGQHLAVLTDKQIKLEPDGSFKITLDSKPANGRPNHMQIRSGFLNLAARDSRSDWNQRATNLEIRLVSGPGLPSPGTDTEQIERIAAGIPDFVNFWRNWKNDFFGGPAVNTFVMPKRRESEGGWGYISGGRFLLKDDEALIVKTIDAGADYTGFQITDPWTLRPETILHTSSLNKGQARPNSDGSYTYVIALQDPGVANWIDTAGLHQGWFQLRWQNVPAGKEPRVLEAALVKLSELEQHLGPGVPMADLAYRREQIRKRIAGIRQRTEEVPPAALKF